MPGSARQTAVIVIQTPARRQYAETRLLAAGFLCLALTWNLGLCRSCLCEGNPRGDLKLILLFHIEETEKSPKCKMEENSGVIANVGKLTEPLLGLVIIDAC